MEEDIFRRTSREKMLDAAAVLSKTKRRYARTISMEMEQVLPEALAEVREKSSGHASSSMTVQKII